MELPQTQIVKPDSEKLRYLILQNSQFEIYKRKRTHLVAKSLWQKLNFFDEYTEVTLQNLMFFITLENLENTSYPKKYIFIIKIFANEISFN